MVRFLTLLLVFALSAFPLGAVEPVEIDHAAISRIEEYLNGIDTAVADFLQVAPDGQVATGKFFLARPGRLRWQYDPPTPLLIVARNENLTYYDFELDQVSHIDVDETLASFLTRKVISFSGDVAITGFEKGSGTLRVHLVQTKRPDEGSVTFLFNESPVELRKMEIEDAAGQKTSVTFSDWKMGTELAESLFIFQNPRLGPKKRN